MVITILFLNAINYYLRWSTKEDNKRTVVIRKKRTGDNNDGQLHGVFYYIFRVILKEGYNNIYT